MYETTKEMALACQSGDEEAFKKLLDKFMPLIKKYSKYFGQNEAEDVRQELSLALYESVKKIRDIENEGQIINYFVKTIRHKYAFLYKNHVKRNEIEEEITDDQNLVYEELSFDDKIFYCDLLQKMEKYSKKQKINIAEIMINDASDIEIAQKLGVSKQYINRIKKKLI